MKAFRSFLDALMLTLLASAALFAQAPDTVWTHTFGGITSDGAYAVQETHDNGYIVAGWTTSSGAGSGDVYLIKTMANGDTLWTKTYGGTQYDYAISVHQTFNNHYVLAGLTGSFAADSDDVYLVYVDSIGDTLWTKLIGGTLYEQGSFIQQTSDSGYIVTGTTSSFGAGNNDVYLLRININGDTVWTRTYGGTASDGGNAVQQTADDGFIIVGRTSSYGAGSSDVYLIKTDANGDTLWTKTYGGAGWDNGNSIQITPDGGYIIAGGTWSFGSGLNDVYLLRINANGDTLWTETFGGTQGEWGWSVNTTVDSGFIVAGYTASFSVGSNDVYLIRTDANGDTFWTNSFGGAQSDGAYSVQQTSDLGYIIAGTTSSFGTGNEDVWLLKTEPDPGVKEERDLKHETRGMRLSVHPNPFSSATTITLHRESQNRRNGEMVIQIYDVSGRKLREISLLPSCPVRESFSNGVSFYLGATWDGRDGNGNVVAPGVYFLKLNGTHVGKVVKVR